MYVYVNQNRDCHALGIIVFKPFDDCHVKAATH